MCIRTDVNYKRNFNKHQSNYTRTYSLVTTSYKGKCFLNKNIEIKIWAMSLQ